MLNTNHFLLSSRWPIACGLALLLALLPLAPASTHSFAAPISPDPSGFAITFNQVADSYTAIPGGTGTFTNFPYAPAIDGGNVSVYATGIGGQQGLYRFTPLPPPIKVADLNTEVPDAPEGVVNFTGFSSAPVISGDSVAFVGFGSGGHQGLYRFVPPNPVRVADLYTLIPNGVGSFTGYGHPTISGSDMVFVGDGSGGQQGVYLVDVAVPIPPPITPIADTNTEIPGGAGNFTRFLPMPPPITPVAPNISGHYVAFFGAGGEEQQGIYLSDVAQPIPPPIMPVADVNTTIPGSANNFQFFTALASEGNDVAFIGGAADADTCQYRAHGRLRPRCRALAAAQISITIC